MKRWVAGIVTVAVFAGIVRWKGATDGVARSVDSPSECVSQMFHAAAEGDVERYLDCFAGDERQRLAREFSGKPVQAATESLKQSVKDLKGWALVNPPLEPLSSPSVLTVEWVYATRVDRQRMETRSEGGEWRIFRVEGVRPELPAIPYGTPVYGPVQPPAEGSHKSD